MEAGLFKIYIVPILIVVLLLTGTASAKPISGAYIQISNFLDMDKYTQTDWNEEIRLMHEAGMDTVIVTAIAEGIAHYPSTLPFVTEVTDAGLIMILNACDTYNMKCHVGLVCDVRWWQSRTEEILASLAANNNAAADELLPIVSQHPSFAGWYLNEEIDFDAFSASYLRTRLINYLLKPVVNHLKAITPDKPVSMAPYFYDLNAQTAQACYDWWNYTLSQVHFDILILQDGFGVEAERKPYEMVPYFREFARACSNNGVQFWNNIEVFNQTDWSARRFIDARVQVSLSEPYAEKVLTFEWFYITPTQRMRNPDGTKDRQNFYVHMLAHNRNYELASLNKTYTCSKPPAADYPDVKHELTDSQIEFTLDSQAGFSFNEIPRETSVTIDLRENVPAKYGFSATFMKYESWSIMLPGSVKIYTSKDNKSFSYLTSLTTYPAANNSLNVYYAFPEIELSARYIKFRIIGTGWVMCSELSVYRNSPTGDLNGDFNVNLLDLNDVVFKWLNPDTFIDFALVAKNWGWNRTAKEAYRSKFYRLKNTQITQDSPYMEGRSAESIASELSVNGIDSVFIMPTSTDGFVSGIVNALHAEGIGAGLMLSPDSCAESILPAGWQNWVMQFINSSGGRYFSFVHPGLRQWMKTRAVTLCNTYDFDAVTFSGPIYPVYDGITKNPVVYADVSPAYQLIFMSDTGETHFPDFTNTASPYYFKTDTALYQKLVQHRIDSITNYFDEIVNGTDGLRQSVSDTLVVTWSMACSKLTNGGVQILPEWEGNNAYDIVKKAKPDIHYFQTHWPDWTDASLSPEHVYWYINNFKEAWRAMQDVAIGIQDDMGSKASMRRSNQYYSDFVTACRASSVSNSTYQCFDIRCDIYTAAPQLKRISRGTLESSIVLEFDQRIHSNSAAVISQRSIVGNLNAAYGIVSADVDGSMLKLELDKTVPAGEMLSVDVGEISDDPAVRVVNADIPAGSTNTIPTGTIVRLSLN